MLLLTLITHTISYTFDDVFISNAVQKYIFEGMKTDPIAEKAKEVKASDNQQTEAYLKAGRIILCDLLEKDPIIQDKNLKEYKYNFDVNILSSFVETIRSVLKSKIQILRNNEIAFFWKLQNPQTNYDIENAYFYYKNVLYKNKNLGLILNLTFSDLAVSPDNALVCSIDNFWRLAVWTIPTQQKEAEAPSSTSKEIVSRKNAPKTQPKEKTIPVFDQQYIDKTVENNVVDIGTVPYIDATSIISVDENWYCSVNSTVYTLRINENSKEIENIREVIYLKPKQNQNLWISKLVAHKNILIVNIMDNGEPDARFFNLSKQNATGYLDETFFLEEDQLNIKLYNQNYVLLVHEPKEPGVVDFIDTYEVLKQRGFSNLVQYLAVDINEIENKVALLNVASRVPEKFAPKVEYTDVIPTNIKNIITEFNQTIENTPNKENAKNLLQKILTKYQELYPQAHPGKPTSVTSSTAPRSMSIWQRLYQKIKNNFTWMRATILGAGIVGLGWLYSKYKPSQVPAAWSKIKIPQVSSKTVAR